MAEFRTDHIGPKNVGCIQLYLDVTYLILFHCLE